MTVLVGEKEKSPSARQVDDIKIMVGGQGGDGTLTVINLVGRVFKHMGLYSYDSRNVLSRIRGGHADGVIRGSAKHVLNVGDGIDVLVAFDEEAVTSAASELSENSVVIYDSSRAPLNRSLVPRSVVYEGKFGERAGTDLKRTLLKNTISFGVLCRVLGVEDKLAESVISARYSRRGEEVLSSNLSALKLGFELASQMGVRAHFVIPKLGANDTIQIDGDAALGIGFIAGGGRFYAGYPITPASEILEYLEANLPKFGGVAIQAEDEISAINMAIGASIAGVRSMVATSGPGQDLMTEGIGQAAMSESPVVIVEVQRTGPSTGEPTKHEQSDVNHVVYGGHGDFPRLVIAPADAQDCFEMGYVSLNLAEKYQLPVFVLMDQELAQNTQCTAAFDFSKVVVERGKLLNSSQLESVKEYKRYELTSDGVSPRTIPGTPNGMFQMTGNEHNEWGMVSVDKENRGSMMRKRFLKVEAAKEDLPKSRFYGDEDADIGIVSFGSNMGPILEAMDMLRDKNVRTKFLCLRTIYPLPSEELSKFLDGVRLAFFVECNLTGQLAGLVKKEVGYMDKVVSLTKYDGTGFRPSQIVSGILSGLSQAVKQS
ncbi:MAG: 2-oxoacid:acceptor oxidoreductase subunit alpha [Thermoprotei archaeon]